jgi:glycerol-3-phosphate acyltransferase PlsX
MRIAIDAMGGDQAPGKIILGAIDALADLEPADELILVGQEEVIRETAGAALDQHANLRIEPATQVISMNDSPVEAIRTKRDSSIVRMVKLARAGLADVLISAGNTGALVAAGVLLLKPLPGVERPGIAVPIPTATGPVMLCDAGANVQPKPQHLHQYAVLTSLYARAVLKIERPRVAILNVGTEEEKGTALVKETRALIETDQKLNFVGYVEGRDMFSRPCDVLVTDGFTGNVVLKVVEGLSASLVQALRQEVGTTSPQAAEELRPALGRVLKRYDHEEYGGAPLLGLSGVLIKAHGAGGARAIRNAVAAAKAAGRLDFAREIGEHLSA